MLMAIKRACRQHNKTQSLTMPVETSFPFFNTIGVSLRSKLITVAEEIHDQANFKNS